MENGEGAGPCKEGVVIRKSILGLRPKQPRYLNMKEPSPTPSSCKLKQEMEKRLSRKALATLRFTSLHPQQSRSRCFGTNKKKWSNPTQHCVFVLTASRFLSFIGQHRGFASNLQSAMFVIITFSMIPHGEATTNTMNTASSKSKREITLTSNRDNLCARGIKM